MAVIRIDGSSHHQRGDGSRLPTSRATGCYIEAKTSDAWLARLRTVSTSNASGRLINSSELIFPRFYSSRLFRVLKTFAIEYSRFV